MRYFIVGMTAGCIAVVIVGLLKVHMIQTDLHDALVVSTKKTLDSARYDLPAELDKAMEFYQATRVSDYEIERLDNGTRLKVAVSYTLPIKLFFVTREKEYSSQFEVHNQAFQDIKDKVNLSIKPREVPDS